MFRVLVIGNVREEALALLRDFAEIVCLPEPTSSEAICEHICAVDAILHKIGKIGPRELAHQTRLRLIARHGVGLDYLDLEAIRALGIPVSITPTANSNAVAEATIGLMLCALRHFSQGDHMLKVDRAWQRERLMGRELKHSTVGLVGYGRIGRLVARYLDAFGARVLVHDPFPQAALDDGRSVLSLDALLGEADVISLHCPLTAATRHVIDAAALARCKPGAVLVNSSRGALVDKVALAEALRQGRLAFAALDAFDSEPPNYDDALFALPNTLTTPHLGAMTLDAQIGMAVGAAKEIRRVLVEGLPPTNNVVPEARV